MCDPCTCRQCVALISISELLMPRCLQRAALDQLPQAGLRQVFQEVRS